jgi:hypothetical protein
MNFFSKRRSDKVVPITQSEIKYYELLKTVSQGDLLSKEEMKFIWGLPRENILVVLKLYNLNLYNITRNKEIILDI